MHENAVSKIIVDCAIEVHKTLGGPGLLERAYEEPFVWELQQAGMIVARQVVLPICYKGHTLESSFRIDLLVNDLVIVECKAAPLYHEIFQSQILTYLRLMNLKLGLVINFGEKLVSNGVHRVVNGL
jgi:GxxExxY protein